MTADTGYWIHDGITVNHPQRLMSSVTARDVTASASETLITADDRDKLSVAVELVKVLHLADSTALDIPKA